MSTDFVTVCEHLQRKGLLYLREATEVSRRALQTVGV